MWRGVLVVWVHVIVLRILFWTSCLFFLLVFIMDGSSAINEYLSKVCMNYVKYKIFLLEAGAGDCSKCTEFSACWVANSVQHENQNWHKCFFFLFPSFIHQMNWNYELGNFPYNFSRYNKCLLAWSRVLITYLKHQNPIGWCILCNTSSTGY